MGRYTSASMLYRLLLVCSLCQAYPGGAPSCSSAPGHGASRGEAAASVRNIGGNTWKVTVSEAHKGLVINTSSKGAWTETEDGYQTKGTCVTHNSRQDKQGTSFTFQAREEGIPSFSGYLVYDYSSYAAINLVQQ